MTEQNIPVPDPSTLTTAQLLRELGALREVLETRLDGMDRATQLLAEELVKLTADFERRQAAQREYILGQIDALSLVSDERFNGIAQRFKDLAERTAQAAEEGLRSLNAALAAAKEAVSEQNNANTQAIAKSEGATVKEIDAIKALLAAGIKGLEDKVSDINKRLDRGEGQGAGRQESRTERRLDVGAVMAAIALVLTVAVIVVNVTKA